MEEKGRIRVSDLEREAVVARLNAATVEGRLSLEEFDDRARLAHAARTCDELTSLIADLPAPLPAGTPGRHDRAARCRRGRWRWG